MKRTILASAFILITLIVAACAPAATETPVAPEPTAMPAVEEPTEEAMEEVIPMDIVDIAMENGLFDTLVAALSAADLAETLKGEGPFTVFAPTDDAFGALPEGTVEALLGDIPALTDILLYHVVPGNVLAEDVVNFTSAETVQGDNVMIRVMDGKVMVDGAEVILTDIQASNGVIHVINFCHSASFAGYHRNCHCRRPFHHPGCRPWRC